MVLPPNTELALDSGGKLRSPPAENRSLNSKIKIDQFALVRGVKSSFATINVRTWETLVGL